MDQTIAIPFWALAFFTAILLPWMLYLTQKDNINSKAIAVMNANQNNISDDIKNLNDRLDKMEDKLDKILDEVRNRGTYRRGKQ